VSDELKVVLQVDPREPEGRQECLPSAPVAPMTRSVSFSEKANVQEYGMILGDNPCVDRGYVQIVGDVDKVLFVTVFLTFLFFLFAALP
jgi:hypothetical protein